VLDLVDELGFAGCVVEVDERLDIFILPSEAAVAAVVAVTVATAVLEVAVDAADDIVVDVIVNDIGVGVFCFVVTLAAIAVDEDDEDEKDEDEEDVLAMDARPFPALAGATIIATAADVVLLKGIDLEEGAVGIDAVCVVRVLNAVDVFDAFDAVCVVSVLDAVDVFDAFDAVGVEVLTLATATDATATDATAIVPATIVVSGAMDCLGLTRVIFSITLSTTRIFLDIESGSL